MKNSIYLAFQYLSFYKLRTIILIFSIGLVLFLPLGLERLIDESEEQMMHRAEATPLVIGASGSATDLVINTLYFEQDEQEIINFGTVEKLNDLSLGYSIPIFSMFKARGYPIVGTDLDYFQFRNLSLKEGRNIQLLGECVLGEDVASSLGLTVGDDIVSSPENVIDIAGVYPLKMKVVGVLHESNTADDQAIFTDLKTNWIIMGLGHGHQDLKEIKDPTIVKNKGEEGLTASTKLYMYNEIKADNIESFHFHGDLKDYPISSVLFVPKDHKSATLLRGKFASKEMDNQISIPTAIIEKLLETIFKIKKVFNMVFTLVGLATVVIVGLIVILTLQLRKDELYTMFMIGASKYKTAQIITSELIMILSFSMLIVASLYSITGLYIQDFIQQFIL